MTQDSPAASSLPEPIPDAGGAPPRRRLALALTLGGLLVAGLALGVPWYLHARDHESTDDAYIDGHVVPVAPRVAGHVQRVAVEDNQLVAQGDVLVELDPADLEAELEQAQASLSGLEAQAKAARANVDVTKVTTEAALAEASSGVALAEAELKSAAARVETAAGDVEEAELQRAAAGAGLEQARAGVQAAEADAERDRLDLTRARELEAQKAATQRDLDHAQAAAHASAARLLAARAQVRAAEAHTRELGATVAAKRATLAEERSKEVEARARVAQAQAQLRSAQTGPERVALAAGLVHVVEAQVAGARAGLELARLRRSYAVVRAPQAGRVTRRSVEAGAYVAVGQTLLTVVPARAWVLANFKEVQLGRMRPGQPVKVTVDAYPDAPLSGRVDGIQAGTGARFSLLPPENASGNWVKVVQRVPVKIVFDREPDPARYRLVPGLSVVAEVDVSVTPAATGAATQRAQGAAPGGAGPASGPEAR
ncbi:MAG: HlyD family efflux transporter periplasmic adaptor subunit [Planctomycetota bacterium]